MMPEEFARGDVRAAGWASPFLRKYNYLNGLTASDLQLATRLAGLVAETDEEIILALAFLLRATRNGSVALDLADLAAEIELDLPAVDSWVTKVSGSVLVTEKVVRVSDGLLYLDRYWREEEQVIADILQRIRTPRRPLDPEKFQDSLARLFPDGYQEQAAAASLVAPVNFSILTGGPGTGKTTTVARLLALLADQYDQPPMIKLAAPTGKAAARLQQAIIAEKAKLASVDQQKLAGLTASTLHRLLGWRRDNPVRFQHDRANPLTADIVVIDETSMVSLTQMARLLEALRPTTQLVLVGDPDQLSSVEAGAVLADLVAGLDQAGQKVVYQLQKTHRYGAELTEFADAIRTGDTAAALQLLTNADPTVRLIDSEDEAEFVAGIEQNSVKLHRLALAGEITAGLAALEQHRLLCAHREGPFGVSSWNYKIERAVQAETGVNTYQEWYFGRPVLITANDYDQDLFNGDSGLVVRSQGKPQIFFNTSSGERGWSPGRLSGVATVHAMTVHKSQGSQAEQISVVLPPLDSALLTREMLYTAVTRAKKTVVMLGTPEQVAAAITNQVRRASGLTSRLAAALKKE